MDGLTATVFEPSRLAVAPGQRIADVLIKQGFLPDVWDDLIVTNRGALVSDFHHVMAAGDEVVVALIPQGGEQGKNIFASVAMLAITVAAPFAATAILGAAAKGTLIHSGLTAGISLMGALAVSALIPPPVSAPTGGNFRDTGRQAAESRTYSFTGASNSPRPFEVVPRVYGRHRVAAALASTPIIDNTGQRSRFAALYDFGQGNLELEDLRMGDQPLDLVRPRMRMLRNWRGGRLKYAHSAVDYDQLAYVLRQNQPALVRTAQDSTAATLDLTFPQGLVRFQGQDRRSASVNFRVRWRPITGGAWTTVPASDYRGGRIESKPFLFQSEYSLPDATRTAWVVRQRTRSDTGTDTKNLIYRDGFGVYESGSYTPGAEPQTINIDGRPYARGPQRDVEQVNDTRFLTFFELLVPQADPASSVTVSAYTAQPLTTAVTIDFPEPGVYEIEVRRTSPESNVDQIRDEVALTLVKSWQDGDVVNLETRHTMVEMAVTATDQISGTIQNLNAVGSSWLRYPLSTGWGPLLETADPASVALDLLTSDTLRKPLKGSQIDWPSFRRLFTRSRQWVNSTVNGVPYRHRRYEFNGVIDRDMPLGESVDAVLSCARSRLIMTAEGKYGVLIDEPQTQERQLITPSNSWNFRGQRTFVSPPHALRVQFVDEEQDWAPAECLVYADGYSKSNAQIFEDLPTFGITSYPHAWRYGRYMMAQGLLRSERFTIEMDIENLVVQRGDLVAVQHDVPLFGGASMRVVSVQGDVITMDRDFALSSGVIALRDSRSGSIVHGDVLAQVSNNSLRASQNIVVMAHEGDLVALGTAGSATRDFIVQSIIPGPDFTATLELQVYDAAVYDAEDGGDLPAWDPGFGRPLKAGTLSVDIRKITQSWDYNGAEPIKEVRIQWRPTGNRAIYAGARIYARLTTQTNQEEALVGQVRDGQVEFTHRIPLSEDFWWEAPVRYRVDPFTSLGIDAKSATDVVTLTPYDVKPLPPRNAYLDVRSQELTVTWQASRSPDVTEYAIRYASELTAVDWNDAQHLVRVDRRTTEITAGARTGVYMIRAINSSGLLSDIVYLRTTVEHLPDLNVVEEIDESAAWPGNKINMDANGYPYTAMRVRRLDGTLVEAAFPVGVQSSLVLQIAGTTVDVGVTGVKAPGLLVTHDAWRVDSNTDQAFYFFDKVVDLGAIYEARIQNKIDSYAVIPPPAFLAAPLGSLAFNPPVAVADEDFGRLWDVWLEYRTIGDLRPMAAWPDLTVSTLPNLAFGTTPWSPWRKLAVGDITARYIQFRIAVESDLPGLRVVIPRGHILIDMPDRQWRKNNLVVPASGLTVNFDPSFAAKPVIAVTIEGATTAVKYETTSVDRLGVTLKLLDPAGTAVAGSIDIAALGYGRQRGQII